VASNWGGKGGPTAGQRIETFWQQFLSDPSRWWDCRSEKATAQYPDFKHKTTQDSLWIGDRRTPPWVDAKLAAMAPGTVQLDRFSWDTRLARCGKAGRHEKTIALFQEMQKKGMTPNTFTFVPVLNACPSLRALEEGRQVHEQIIQSGCEGVAS
jgi:pentatricopeptide repeat protein